MSNFIPNNDLERSMLQAQNGEISFENFMGKLIAAHVFLPVRKPYEIAGQPVGKTVPLSVKNDTGQDVLILFTSKERSADFLKNHKDYRGGVEEEFGKILLMNGVGYAVSINPELEIGLDLEPDMVEQIVQLTGPRAL